MVSTDSPDNQIKLIQVRNPFRRDERTTELVDYRFENITRLIARVIPEGLAVVVSINSIVIDEAKWESTTPCPGDYIFITPRIADGDGVLGALLMIAVVVAAPYLAVGVFGSVAGTVGALTTFGTIASPGGAWRTATLTSTFVPVMTRSPANGHWDTTTPGRSLNGGSMN